MELIKRGRWPVAVSSGYEEGDAGPPPRVEKERKEKEKELFSGFNCVRYTCSFHLDRHFARPSLRVTIKFF